MVKGIDGRYRSEFGRHCEISESELNYDVNVYGPLIRSGFVGLGIAHGAENLGAANNLNLLSNPDRGYQI